MNIHELLEDIEKRPELYLDCQSINYLRVFLSGYGSALHDYHLDKPYDEFDNFIVPFQRWLAKKYSVKSSQNWAQIILFQSFNEQDALKEFFLLYKEFMEASKEKNMSR